MPAVSETSLINEEERGAGDAAMAKKKLNIGLIGYGFMGRAHSNAYLKVNRFFDLDYEPVLKAACARKADKLKPFADRWGWETTEADWRALIERRDIDVVDIASPNNTHHDIALAAAKAGKMVFSEKPLAMNSAEALEMTEAVEKAGVPNMVWFNYRRVPAIAFAKQLIDEGRIGRVFHYRAKYLQDWTISPDVPQGGQTLWRLDADVAGSGVTGDLLAHSIDTAIWLNGPIQTVSAMTETFVKERPVQDDPNVRKPVRIDDACAFLARFSNNTLATFESTRYACGRKNQNVFEINGEHGSIYFDLEDAHQLQYYDHRDDSHVHGWRTILVTDSDHPYMGHWWVPGCVIGYEHTFIHALADFLKGLETGEPAKPNFRDALETQRVCDAVLASAQSGQWVQVAT
jgi:predicted dehydrogenase